MIRLPQRSVTRFFIPLIDVLTLLFCIFLVLPLAKSPEDQPAPDAGRMPEPGAQACEIEGIALPRLAVAAGQAALPLVVTYLRTFNAVT